MKKWIKILLGIVLVGALASKGSYYLGNKFDPGECIGGLDGYVWHINRYALGEYQVMGWQKPWWGNEVSLERSLLESKNASDVPLYHQIDCPTLAP